MSQLDTIPINWFAKKYVSRLWSHHGTIWDAIELMNDLNIRHIPLVDGIDIIGMINSSTLLSQLSNYTDNSTFNQPLTNLVSDEYLLMEQDEPLQRAIDYIVQGKNRAVITIDQFMIEGIFTSYDIVLHDFLWTEINDQAITTETNLGYIVNEFNCIPSHSTVIEAFKQMELLGSEVIGVIDSGNNTLISTLDFVDVIHYLNRYCTMNGYSWDGVFKSNVGSIFPSSGLYTKEPISLMDLRRKFIDNEIFHTILLDEEGMPKRLISIQDLVSYFVKYQ